MVGGSESKLELIEEVGKLCWTSNIYEPEVCATTNETGGLALRVLSI